MGEKLKTLKKLVDEELISPQEFETSKKALLDKM
ncbi:SHOCT domain-containing protein [Paenibacillus sp. FSL L8-0641]